ncbi:MAG: hypothetical protein JXR64_04355 [Spirochaetales bacterium]|nr:hypothetical protein [Spirochaetales bacterium]
MKKYCLVIFSLLGVSIFSFDNYIGFTPKEIVNQFGSPDFVYTLRGSRPEEDDVVFFYDSRLYIYFNQNRVWQLRVDEQTPFEINGIKMGDSKEKVSSILGEIYEEKEDSLVFKRPDAGYPVYIKLFFSGAGVNDIYMYRGDY